MADIDQPLSTANGDFRNTNYETFILGVSVVAFLNVFPGYFLSHGQYREVLIIVNAFLCPVFFIDFLARLRRTPSKRAYLIGGGGTLDLLSSIPYYPLALLRLSRIVRVSRALNAGGVGRMRGLFIRQLAEGALLAVVFFVVVLMEAASILVLLAERGAPGANIETAGDAIWWCYVTLTTVGYGDYYPVTSQGRMVGFLVLTFGLALFATITGYIANQFVSRRAAIEAENRAAGSAKEGVADAEGS